MFFGTDANSRAKVVQRSRFNFLREAQIWYNRQPDQRALSEDSDPSSTHASGDLWRSWSSGWERSA
jgi:hypothetical protein